MGLLPLGSLGRRGIVVPFVHRRLRRRMLSFGYQHGATDWFHNSYKHSTPPCTFF